MILQWGKYLPPTYATFSMSYFELNCYSVLMNFGKRWDSLL